MNTYKLTHEGYVLKNGTDKVPTTSSPAAPNMNPDYLEYLEWLKDGFEPEPADPLPVEVPQTVTRRQAKQALLLAGLLDNVQPAINAIPDATQRALIQIEWDDSQMFERSRPALIGLGSALGLGAGALDALFIQAAAL